MCPYRLRSRACGIELSPWQQLTQYSRILYRIEWTVTTAQSGVAVNGSGTAADCRVGPWRHFSRIWQRPFNLRQPWLELPPCNARGTM
jgi:hypothetical protein